MCVLSISIYFYFSVIYFMLLSPLSTFILLSPLNTPCCWSYSYVCLCICFVLFLTDKMWSKFEVTLRCVTTETNLRNLSIIVSFFIDKFHYKHHRIIGILQTLLSVFILLNVEMFILFQMIILTIQILLLGLSCLFTW